MTSVALVPYERKPRFVPSVGAASTICRWNPYHVLGLVPEQVDSLISLLACAGRDPIAHRTLQLRQAEIRAAYLDLAAAYHPDADKQMRPSTFTWISAFDHFAAISSSYKVLNDLIHAVEYGVASMNPEGAGDILDCTASEVSAFVNTAATCNTCVVAHNRLFFVAEVWPARARAPAPKSTIGTRQHGSTHR
jgi:hypothetical protein